MTLLRSAEQARKAQPFQRVHDQTLYCEIDAWPYTWRTHSLRNRSHWQPHSAPRDDPNTARKVNQGPAGGARAPTARRILKK
jgi:hypothetical protein